jgi:hypothetical protein
MRPNVGAAATGPDASLLFGSTPMADEATLLKNLDKNVTGLGKEFENLGKGLEKRLDKLEKELQKTMHEHSDQIIRILDVLTRKD